MNLKETYNHIAEDWHKDHLRDDWWIAGVNKFVSLLKPGSKILDVGCAGGTKSEYLIEKGFSVVGIDFSDKMIEIAKREVPEGEFLVCDLSDADKLSDDFDGIIMQAVLLHIPKNEVPEKLKNLLKRLKKEGYLYVSVKQSNRGLDEEMVIEDDYGYKYERFFSYFKKDELELIFRNLGIKIVYSDISLSGHTRWIQVIGQK